MINNCDNTALINRACESVSGAGPKIGWTGAGVKKYGGAGAERKRSWNGRSLGGMSRSCERGYNRRRWERWAEISPLPLRSDALLISQQLIDDIAYSMYWVLCYKQTVLYKCTARSHHRLLKVIARGWTKTKSTFNLKWFCYKYTLSEV